MKSFIIAKSYLKRLYRKVSLGGKRTTVGYGFALLLLALLSVTSYQNATELSDNATEIRQTQVAFLTLTEMSALLIDAESARPGYFLLDNPDDPEELARERTAVDLLYTRIEQLRPLLNSFQSQQQLDRLQTLIAQRVQLTRQQVQSKPSSNPALADDRANPSDTLMLQQIQRNRQEVRQILDSLRLEESDLVQTYLDQSQRNLRSRLFIERWGSFLTFLIMLSVYLMLRRQKLGRERAEEGRRQMVQQKALTDLKLEFFSMVSHEFRTPLSLISGSAQLLNESLKPLVATRKLKNLQRIQTSAKLMSQMLNDVLMIARADAGKLEFNPKPLELQTFCLNLIEDMQVFSPSARSIQFSYQGQITHAQLDEKLLYSLLSNLLSNALKYSPLEAPVRFHLVSNPNQITFQVRDQGIGIVPEDLPNLYQPFSRGHNTGTALGSGLGLTVVKRCVELHHGEILVESAIAQGTTFTVILPTQQTSLEASRNPHS
ncbi:MAG: ATP-binding protein [Oculatellaceae cyanobacterium Prado106]|jgi:signal transduction histidine kinase|nr:ATP-binding protein [Oculatellaceae cyanobacterium Prado106]